MFNKTRTSLKGQLVAACNLGWDGELYVIIPKDEAEQLLVLVEVSDAPRPVVSSSGDPDQCPWCLRHLGEIS